MLQKTEIKFNVQYMASVSRYNIQVHINSSKGKHYGCGGPL